MNETDQAARADAPASKDPTASLAGQVSHLGNGDRSLLRRMGTQGTPEGDGLVHGMLARAGVRPGGLHDDEFAMWRTTAIVAAIVSGSAGRPCHQPGRSLGRALGDAGVSRVRLTRAASGDHDAVVRLVRMADSKGRTPFDLSTVRDLLDPEPATRSRAARRLVIDHQSAQYAQSKKDDRA